MPKYWGKQIFTHGRFPEVGQKQKTEKKKKKKREKLNVGDNNGQATHGARKHAWRVVIILQELGVAHAMYFFLHKSSASGVSPEWVKSKRRRREEKKRKKSKRW